MHTDFLIEYLTISMDLDWLKDTIKILYRECC